MPSKYFEDKGQKNCPVFCDEDGFQLYANCLSQLFTLCLEERKEINTKMTISLRTWWWSTGLGLKDPKERSLELGNVTRLGGLSNKVYP